MEEILTKAVIEYFYRIHFVSRPDGSFGEFDIWTPSKKEFKDCCKKVRPPSENYPHSWMHHCKTIIHISNLFGVDYITLKKNIVESRFTLKNIEKLSLVIVKRPNKCTEYRCTIHTAIATIYSNDQYPILLFNPFFKENNNVTVNYGCLIPHNTNFCYNIINKIQFYNTINKIENDQNPLRIACLSLTNNTTKQLELVYILIKILC